VFKYSNAVGFTDFVGGLIPDYFIEDELIGAEPFGDLKDPVLNTALQTILADDGDIPKLKSARRTLAFEKIEDELTRRKQNLYVIPENKDLIRHK